MERTVIEQTILSYLRLHIQDKGIAVDIDTSLISSGVLDSLAVFDLVGYIEQTYRIQLTADEMNAECLDTVTNLSNLIQSRDRAGSRES